MNTTWKTVRLFISSTFRDMQAERDHLVRFVFPKLREEMLQHHIHFVDVDLRWGVTSEQNAIEACREIIDECRPRFLCMLGGRYGWVPPGKSHSITADEVYYGVLNRPLNERAFAYFYFRDEATTTTMVETSPGEFREPPGSPKQKKLSELKQAIVAAGLNPFTYPAQWDHESLRLTGLKTFGDRVYHDLLASMKADSELRDRFVTDATVVLDEFAEENAAMEAFIEERSERFVLGSREPVLNELLTHISRTGGKSYVCLTGASGSGKSALLAYMSHHPILNTQPSTLLIRHFVGATPGSTDVRQTLRRLCHELKVNSPDITAEIPEDPETLQRAFPDFLGQACAKQRVVILLDAINQFNPGSQSVELRWLPQELPGNARIILSSLDGPALEELRRRPSKPREIELRPLETTDGEAIIEQFLNRYRKKFEPDQRAALLAKSDAGTPLYLIAALEELRTLGTYEEINQRIVELPPTTHTLFKWILERLENDDGFRDVSGRLVGRELVSRFAALLGSSRYGLNQGELADLLDVDDPQGNVAALLHLLRPYLMRRGELRDFYHGQFREAALSEYLDEQHERVAAHRSLADYFRRKADPRGDARWTGGSSRGLSELPYHQTMAEDRDGVFTTLTDFTFLEQKTATGSQIHKDADGWVTVNFTGVFDLLADYERALHAWPDSIDTPAKAKMVEALAGAIPANAHVLTNRPYLFWQQVYSRLQWSADPVRQLLESESARRQGPDAIPWLRLATPLRESSGLIKTLMGHQDYVEFCSFSSDGLRIASASTFCSFSRDGLRIASYSAAKLWDAVSGELLADLDTQLLTGTRNASVAVWDARTGILLSQLGYDDRGRLGACLFSPDGTRLLVASMYELAMWHVASGKRLPVFAGKPEGLAGEYPLAFSPDGKLVASAHWPHVVVLWDANTGQIEHDLVGHTGWLTCIAFSPDGSRVVSASEDDEAYEMRLWDVHSGREIALLKGHTYLIKSCCFSPDGSLILSASSDGTAKVWDGFTGTLLHDLMGHELAVWGCAFSPDAKHISTSSWDASIRVWDSATGEQLTELRGHTDRVNVCSYSPDGSKLVSGSWDKTVRVWNAKAMGGVDTASAHEASVTACAAASHAEVFATASNDHTLRIWDGTTRANLATLKGHADYVTCCAFSPTSARLISGSEDGRVRLWDAQRYRCVRTLAEHDTPITACSFRRDGQRFLSGAADGSVRVWNLKGVCVASLSLAIGRVSSCVFSPDGAHVLIGAHPSAYASRHAGSLLLCNADTLDVVTCLDDSWSPVAVCNYSPDGMRIMAGYATDVALYSRRPTQPGTLKLWDGVTGRLLRTMDHPDYWPSITRREGVNPYGPYVTAVRRGEFSPDGLLLATSSDDGTVCIWDARDGTLRTAVLGHDGAMVACSFSPDSASLMSVAGDGSVKIWSTSTGEETYAFWIPGRATAAAWNRSGRSTIVGDEFGQVYLLTLHGNPQSNPFATAQRN